MTHLLFEDTEGNTEAVLCTERKIGSCYILASTPERVEELVQAAKAMKVDQILMVVDENEVEEFELLGWSIRSNLVVLSKE